MSAKLSSIYEKRGAVASTHRHAACAHVEQAPHDAVRTRTQPRQPGLLEVPRGAVIAIFSMARFPSILQHNQASSKGGNQGSSRVIQNSWVGPGQEFFRSITGRVESTEPDPTGPDRTGPASFDLTREKSWGQWLTRAVPLLDVSFMAKAQRFLASFGASASFFVSFAASPSRTDA